MLNPLLMIVLFCGGLLLRAKAEDSGAQWQWPLALPKGGKIGQAPDCFLGLGGQGTLGEGKGWQSGTFGFVRQLMKWQDQTIFTLFHEGIDLAPQMPGVPEDVFAAAGGRVWATSDSPFGGHGRWMLIQHQGNSSGLFSRYAHLHEVALKAGDEVKVGQRLGTLGWSGTGLTRERAHLHFELGIMLNQHFAQWHRHAMPDEAPATAADYRNFGQIDPMAWLKGQIEPESASKLTLAECVGHQPVAFEVTLPKPSPESTLDLLQRCPWLWHGKISPSQATAWHLFVTAWGLPVKITDGATVAQPTVTWVQPFAGKHAWKTQGLLEGSGSTANLSDLGKLWASLILGL